jgi:hypothetical protein
MMAHTILNDCKPLCILATRHAELRTRWGAQMRARDEAIAEHARIDAAYESARARAMNGDVDKWPARPSKPPIPDAPTVLEVHAREQAFASERSAVMFRHEDARQAQCEKRERALRDEVRGLIAGRGGRRRSQRDARCNESRGIGRVLRLECETAAFMWSRENWSGIEIQEHTKALVGAYSCLIATTSR